MKYQSYQLREIEDGLDIMYEHTKVEEEERGEAQGSLTVIGSLVSLCLYMSRSNPFYCRVMAMSAS